MMIFVFCVELLIDIFILINGWVIKLKWYFVNVKEVWKVFLLENISVCFFKNVFIWLSGLELSLVKINFV